MRFLSTRLFRQIAPFLLLAPLLSGSCFAASDPWNAPSFSASPEELTQAAAAIKPQKDTAATVLLSDMRFTFDSAGRCTEVYHSIYRIENAEGVKGWAETSGSWEPWYQAKPEIHARVIAADRTVHTLDPKTLTDVPVNDDSPDTYTQRRRYAGPLPAIDVGAIVEEEVTIRDTSPFFAAGEVQRHTLARYAMVNQTRVVISHPESLPLRYRLNLLPEAHVAKSVANGIETISVENGRIDAVREDVANVPPDVVVWPQIEFGTGTSWQKVAAEYVRLSGDKLRATDVAPLLAKLKLKRGSRQNAIRSIVAALHKNIRYTGVEFGDSSLIPQFPSETLKRKYGDCKDKATLLAAMLRAGGIPASLALLDAGPGQDINPDLPGMGMFDHAIVYLPPDGNNSEMWIDATADYTQVGFLPYMDYGRWALIADDQTTQLKKIPEITSSQNLHRELRQFTMADFGKADIIETDEQVGPDEDRLREFYTGDPKRIRANSDNYVKSMYLADSLISLDHGDLTDMSKPFSVSYVTKGGRGITDLSNATMAVRQESIFDGFPDYFYKKEDAAANTGNPDDKPKPRSVDWWIQPFATEWHYKIIAPIGFKLRALPPDKDQALATAHYSQQYTSNREGTVVEAVFRFDSGNERLTPAEGRLLRDAIVKARESDPILITFDQVGFALFSAGHVKEALAAEQHLVTLQPKQALHHVQLAQLLLEAGLGERARAEAQAATALDPKSPQAFSTLGWVLEHDLIGRRFKKGFDYEGAVAAYRKAKLLDPKNKDVISNLGYLLEFDKEGTRYSAKAHMEEAVAEFKDLKKVDEQEGRRYEDNILFDLWYAHKFKDCMSYAEGLPATETRKSFIVAAIAADQGSDAALKKSLEITTDEDDRNKILANAGSFLLQVQNYARAAELFEAAARNQSDGAQLASLVSMLKKTKPRAELKSDPADPADVVQQLFSGMLSSDPSLDQLESLFIQPVRDGSRDPKRDQQEFRHGIFELRAQLESSQLPFQALGDMVLSNLRYTKEGDETTGYRVTMIAPGAEPQHIFVARENGVYKVVEFSKSGSSVPEEIGWEVLDLLRKGNLTAARKWLDWARDKVHMTAGDDPLAGQPFPHFWTKGQQGDEAAARTAALVLLPSRRLKPEHFAALVQARDHAKDEAARTQLNLVLAYAYSVQEKWPQLLEVSERLRKAAPDSLIAFNFATGAMAQLKKFDDWEKLVQAQMQKHPDDRQYIRSAALLDLYRGDVVSARKLYKNLMDQGKANSDDLNGYAWDALMLPEGVDQDALDAALRANDLTKNGSFAILHTLACLYAEAGKATQARELLLKAMKAGELEEPDSEVWFAYGKIAEQYGELEAAQKMYARVEKPTAAFPASSYDLAQKRILALKNSGGATKSGIQ